MSSNRAQGTPDGALFFLDPAATDNGKYSCSVENLYRASSTLYYIQVIVSGKYLADYQYIILTHAL